VTDGGSGSTTSVYTNNDVLQTVSSPARQKQLEYNGLGQLSSVCEITSGTTQYPSGNCAQKNNQTGYWTKYTYDALGDLAGVTQNAQSSTQQTRTYGYDMLGRLASEANPESGTTTYYWDAAAPSCGGGAYATPGDLGAKKDNAGVYTCYGYDALHRLLGFGPSTSTQCSGFVYDAATPPSGVSVSNTKGRLINAYTNSACDGRTSLVTDKWLGYSPRGEVTDIYSSTPNSGGYYHVTKSYWPHGALKSLGGIPGVPTIYYGASDASGLDGEGRVTKVSPSSGGDLVSAVTYGGTGQPVGALTQITYGSSDFDNFSYDPKTGRMTGYQFNVGTSGKAVVGALIWNSNGTLQTLNITDPFNSANQQNCTYGYDALGRTTSVSCNNGTAWGQNFAYDYFGNITKSVPTGATGVSFLPTYSETTNHYSVLCGQLAYDNNGNLKNDCFHTYQWDANGHPVMIGTDHTQTYDALGYMVESNQGGDIYQYLHDTDGKVLGNPQAQSGGYSVIPLVAGARAIYYQGLQGYMHVDWLGTARLTSDLNRGVSSDAAAAPYGEAYPPPVSTLGVFAGMEPNLEPDLYDGVFREYHPTQGRWITPDPAGLAAVDPSNPQTWNRYAYAANNPLSATDPLGLYDVACGALDCGGGDYGGIVPCDELGILWCGPPGLPCASSDPNCNYPTGPVVPPWRGPSGGRPGGPSSGGGSHGPWPGNETTGLPQLPTQPLSLGDLLGMTPGCDFGVCNPIGNGLVPGVIAAGGIGSGICILVEPCGLAEILLGVAAMGVLYEATHPPQNTTGRQAKCTLHDYDRQLKLCTYLCDDGQPDAQAAPGGDPTKCPGTYYRPWRGLP
jgi:RHS repeat-associated protein